MKKIEGLHSILLIDDDDATNFYNKQVIKKSGIDCHVQIAIDGREGLQYLINAGQPTHLINPSLPGIIFLDINMPGMNGWEFLDEYAKLYKNAKMIIVLLSTSNNPADEQRAKGNNNITAFIQKPLSLAAFESVIDQYLKTISENSK